MNSLLFPSKLVGERITITFPFQDELGWGETISSATVFAEVYSGTDLDPELIVYQFPIFTDGVNVTQRIRAGEPGVIYRVSCRIMGSAGTEAEKGGFLAILPGTGIVPPLDADYFTSQIYPAINLDSFRCFPSIVSASKTRLIIQAGFQVDSFRCVPSILSAFLGAVLKQNEALEDFRCTPSIIASALDTILIQQDALEDFRCTPQIVSSTLDTIVLQNDALEDFRCVPSILSSTLDTV